MFFLHTFPTRAESYLDVWEVDSTEIQFSEWKYYGQRLPEPKWARKYCVCLENEQRFFIFPSYQESLNCASAKHIPVSIIGRQHTERSFPAVRRASCLSHEISGQMVKSERSSIPCFQSLEKQRQDPSKQTVLGFQTKVQSGYLRDEFSTPSFEYKHTAHSHSKSVNSNRFNRRLRAKTVAALADHVWCPFGYDETTSFNVSVPSLTAQSTPTDINLTGDTVSNSLSILDAAFEASQTALLDCPNSLVHCQLVKRTPSRLQRFLRNLRRSFSSQHVGLDGPTQPHTPGVSQQIQASSVQLCSDRIHTERRRRPKSNARLSRLFQCITVGDVNRLNGHSGLFLLRNDTCSNPDCMGDLRGNRFYSCPGGSYPNCVALDPHPLSDSLMATGTPNDSGHVTRSSTTPLFPVGDSIGSVSFIGSGHQRSIPPHRSSQLLARLDTAPGYLLTFPGLVHFGALHPTLTGGREFCFFCSAPASTCIKSSEYQRLSSDAVLLSRIFAAPSFLSRLRWLRSLRRTAKPNLENERHRENSLKLSILEARNLSSKRRCSFTTLVPTTVDLLCMSAAPCVTLNWTPVNVRRLLNKAVGGAV